MSVVVEKYLDVGQRLKELGYIAQPSLTILPANFDTAQSASELNVAGTASTVSKVLRHSGLDVSILGAEQGDLGYIHNKSHDWVVPVIFVSAELMKANPYLIGTAIDLVRDYVLTLFRGFTDRKAIKAEIIVETAEGGTYQRVTYEGGVDGLKELAKLVKDVHAKG